MLINNNDISLLRVFYPYDELALEEKCSAIKCVNFLMKTTLLSVCQELFHCKLLGYHRVNF